MSIDLPPQDYIVHSTLFEKNEDVKKDDKDWKKKLTKEQYCVLREKGTERAFSSALYNNKKPGVYQCAGCDTTLFSSDHKFQSGTGWPSYYQAISDNVITYKEDHSAGMARTEILCANCEGHLGHVFNDGPSPTYMRYCVNGAALKFKESSQSN